MVSEAGKITINLLGSNPSIGAKKTKYVAGGNQVTLEIDNIEINLDLKDFKYLLEEGESLAYEYHESKAGLEARIEELNEALGAALEEREMRESA